MDNVRDERQLLIVVEAPDGFWNIHTTSASLLERLRKPVDQQAWTRFVTLLGVSRSVSGGVLGVLRVIRFLTLREARVIRFLTLREALPS